MPVYSGKKMQIVRSPYLVTVLVCQCCQVRTCVAALLAASVVTLFLYQVFVRMMPGT
jgi:hypothetical protein